MHFRLSFDNLIPRLLNHSFGLCSLKVYEPRSALSGAMIAYREDSLARGADARSWPVQSVLMESLSRHCGLCLGLMTTMVIVVYQENCISH